MKDEIKNIISSYCEVLCVEDFDAMITEIKQAILNQLDDSDYLAVAKSNVTNNL